MRKNRLIWSGGLICLLLLSCGETNREKQLNIREQALAEKERQFQLKEQDYAALLQMRDSLLAQHVQATAWPPGIQGAWNSRLVCTESQCTEYAIGDQKTNETWDFINDSTGTLVAIRNKDRLVRIYTGRYDSSSIRLYFKTDSTARRTVEMNVLLHQVPDGNLKGTQTITIDSACSARFSVELSRIQKN